MKNLEITKKIFFFTIFLLVVNFFIFLYDGILGFFASWYGAIFYLPLSLLVILIDRFYLKNHSAFFFKNIILTLIIIFTVYLFSQAYSGLFSL